MVGFTRHRRSHGSFLRLFCRFKHLRVMLMLAILVVVVLMWAHCIEDEAYASRVFQFGETKLITNIGRTVNTSRNGLSDQTTSYTGRENSLKESEQLEHSVDQVKRAELEKITMQNDKTFVEGKISQTPSKVRSAFTQDNMMSEDQAFCSWCNKTNTGGNYFLSAVLLVRIYSSDLARLSTRELHQWLYYLRFAGFEHVYIYDAYVKNKESQKDALEFLIKQGLVTYVDWSENASPYSVTGTQESAYQDCLDKWGKQSTWQASFDIDEYPFCPQDRKPNFMQRFVANFSRERPDVSQITMKNFLFLGKPLDDELRPFLVDRLKRRTHGPANALVKPIYRSRDVGQTHVHHHDLDEGVSMDADETTIRLNHYWGGRLQNWGDDTPEILAKTREDNSVQEIVEYLQNCSSACLPSQSIINSFRWN